MKRLLLLGGGHAHVHVIEAFGRAPSSAAEVVLLSENRLTPYSGMLPGLIAGHYRYAEAHIDLAALCARCGVRFIEQRALALDAASRRVATACGESHTYDLLSVNTGSTPPLAVPGAQQHAIAVKPIAAFLHALEALVRRPHDCAEHGIVVVGTGAAGVEVVLALDYRLRRHLGAARRPPLRLAGESDAILEQFPRRVRYHAERILRRQMVEIHTAAKVAEVDANGIRLHDGQRIAASHVVFATGAAAPPLFARAGLATDQRGFITVGASLQSTSHPEIFAAGDVASVVPHPRPKAGVFAVRQGPWLARNLRRALAGKAPRSFVPQRHYLVLLSAGAKHAIATRNGFTLAGDWVWRWKDRIDRRFVARFGAALDA
ncbi:MAG: FAD-dependent oxidoreductase [Burkholderiales bacterium]|nr:FAD-dependent oxidoreductase [Burkholderiales bacterium]